MKCIVWGTGNIYRKFSCYLDSSDIIFLVDSDEKKQHTILEGKLINPPSCIVAYEFDYIIVMVERYQEIYTILKSWGIDTNKITNYLKMFSKLKINPRFVNSATSLDCFMNSHENPVIVITPNFSRTGVPIIAFNTTVMLNRMGYATCLIGGNEGELEIELIESNILYINNLNLFYNNNYFIECLDKAKNIIVLSTISSEYIDAWSLVTAPIHWWLHESDQQWYDGRSLTSRNNIHFWGGGERVITKFSSIYPQVPISKLLYHLFDARHNDVKRPVNKSKRIFATIGVIDSRKATDILISAILKMDPSIREKCEFWIIGGVADDEMYTDLKNKTGNIRQIVFWGSLERKKILDIYDSIDVLVCVSRDDPMPLVVTEAMQHGIPCIISDQVGQAEFCNDEFWGKVVGSEDIDSLVNAIEFYSSCNDDKFAEVNKSKKIFDLYFSERAFQKKMNGILTGE